LVPIRYLNHIQRNSFMFILCMNYAYNNRLTSTNSSYLFAQKSLQCKQTNYQLISAVAVRCTCHLRADCPPYTLCYYVNTVKKLYCFAENGTSNIFPTSLIWCQMIMLSFFWIFFSLHEKRNPMKKKFKLDNKSLNLFTWFYKAYYLLIGTLIFVGIYWMLVFWKPAYFNPILN
jgi:hypothetical protein